MEKELVQLFHEQGQDDDALVDGIARLATRKGPQVYQKALQILAGKDFSPELAQQHWQAILAHCRRLFPDQNHGCLRAALVDYLHREIGELRDPRVLEAEDLEEVRRASITDGLTSLYRQCYFKGRLNQLFALKKRAPRDSFAVVLFDLDHFKQYNDRFGHLAGDAALRRVAETLRLNIRDYDVAARYGGEEFALLLFRVDRQQALSICERIRAGIEALAFPGQDQMDGGGLTISGGLAFFPEDGAGARELLEKADQRLYEAKNTRNTLVPRNVDRRQAQRRAVRSVVELCPGSDELSFPGMTTDLSSRGLSLDCAVSFTPGTTVQVRFLKPFWGEDRETRATVRRIRRDEQSGVVHLGLEFEGHQDQLAALGALQQKPATLDLASSTGG